MSANASSGDSRAASANAAAAAWASASSGDARAASGSAAAAGSWAQAVQQRLLGSVPMRDRPGPSRAMQVPGPLVFPGPPWAFLWASLGPSCEKLPKTRKTKHEIDQNNLKTIEKSSNHSLLAFL